MTNDELRCPRCGIGVVVDLAYDAGAVNEDGDPIQDPNARQLTTYSCGHQVEGSRLATADPDVLDVERRTTDETVDPPADPG